VRYFVNRAPGSPAGGGGGGGGGMPQYFEIVSRMHGLALDVKDNSRQPGAQVVPWHKSGADNQLWYDDHATGTIRSKLNGLCLDIEGTRTPTPRTPISRSTQPCIPPGSLNRVPASAGVRAGVSSLPGGR